MSKLSPALKGLINAPFARPGQTPAPANIRSVYERIAREASEKKYGRNPWLTISAAATFTLNSPDALHSLFQVSQQQQSHQPRDAAELIREVGLKCISFNGIPRTINCLGAFRSGLDASVQSQLSTKPSRYVDASNVDATNARGRQLWQSIYTPFDTKLFDKLAESHPDLPVYILGSHYSTLLSDPAERNGLASIGRGLTSIVAVSCLRAQTGVGPQVLSHVFGLRKAVEQGAHQTEAAEDVDGIERLASDEGCEWILKSVDSISEAIGGSFAQARESKL
ncbi:hypothetical protein CONLIGDRAFT_638065 [Coniochaeta ligniaria NRRL 30616]|uniref:Mitochondrial protein n=1 Tax=Coniochaeta ligniaria NRRL 30616 TaxID=1408157 RepID=A0A1J7IYY1_9PEZI|nr:hypothetical protein CONLIGDRAFT_638065 [Coniochaeta ligniaria NRRL 30616]